jgi:hypothetical protein
MTVRRPMAAKFIAVIVVIVVIAVIAARDAH